ncbi:hypothetical protein Hanom_Chr16g01442301 [Helianthus anomalus]
MRNLMFTHGVWIGLPIPGFFTRVYKVPNKRKSFTLLISHLQTLIRSIFFLALLFSAEDKCSDPPSAFKRASQKLNIRN